MTSMALSNEPKDSIAQVEALLRIVRRIKRERDAARRALLEALAVQLAMEVLLDAACRVAEEDD